MFVHVEPLRKKSDLVYALKSFEKEIGVPEALILDVAPEENSPEVFDSLIRKPSGSVMFKPLEEEVKEDFIECED